MRNCCKTELQEKLHLWGSTCSIKYLQYILPRKLISLCLSGIEQFQQKPAVEYLKLLGHRRQKEGRNQNDDADGRVFDSLIRLLVCSSGSGKRHRIWKLYPPAKLVHERWKSGMNSSGRKQNARLMSIRNLTRPHVSPWINLIDGLSIEPR